MKKIIYYFIVLVYASCWHSCTEEGNIYYLDSNVPAPKQISDLKVVNTPGGAIITYKIPNDKNLSYVKAVYEIQPGIFREAKSSYYKDTLALVGFGDTLTHNVEIYSVGRNEKKSDPLLVEVKPLTPSVHSVFKTLTLDATFGGVNVAFENTSQANLAVVVIMDTTEQYSWIPLTTYYTAALDGNFSARGLEPKERKFAVYIRDRWNNKSDTLIKSLTPLYEELIPKSPWKALHLTGDTWEPSTATLNLERVWDDIVNNPSNLFEPRDQKTQPQWFTVDLNQKAVFSRLKLFQRTAYPYNASWVKSFEIWGTNNYDPKGGWENWVLLGKFNGHIPSGSVWPNYTADDMVYERNGEDFTFIQPVPAVRYMRFKFLDTYGGTAKYWLSELTFWGQIVP